MTLPRFDYRRLALGLAGVMLSLGLAGCETGPQVVENSVAQCVQHVRLGDDTERYCHCLGDELTRRFSYAEIRRYRLRTDNWTNFADVADDEALLAINQTCRMRQSKGGSG